MKSKIRRVNLVILFSALLLPDYVGNLFQLPSMKFGCEMTVFGLELVTIDSLEVSAASRPPCEVFDWLESQQIIEPKRKH